MAEALADTQALESTTVGIYRTATVVKGGRRFSFAALVVVGDRHGGVGIGYGKAPGVPAAIEKAQKDARKQMSRVKLLEGTLPHPVTGRFGSAMVRLLPAAPGTGVIAGGTVRAVLEMAGVNDCLSKAYGSTNKKNLCKAVMNGLELLRTKQHVAQLRGVELDETEAERKITAAQKFMAESAEQEQAAATPATTGRASATPTPEQQATAAPGAERGEQAGGGGAAPVQGEAASPAPAPQEDEANPHVGGAGEGGEAGGTQSPQQEPPQPEQEPDQKQ